MCVFHCCLLSMFPSYCLMFSLLSIVLCLRLFHCCYQFGLMLLLLSLLYLLLLALLCLVLCCLNRMRLILLLLLFLLYFSLIFTPLFILYCFQLLCGVFSLTHSALSRLLSFVCCGDYNTNHFSSAVFSADVSVSRFFLSSTFLISPRISTPLTRDLGSFRKSSYSVT